MAGIEPQGLGLSIQALQVASYGGVVWRFQSSDEVVVRRGDPQAAGSHRNFNITIGQFRPPSMCGRWRGVTPVWPPSRHRCSCDAWRQPSRTRRWCRKSWRGVGLVRQQLRPGGDQLHRDPVGPRSGNCPVLESAMASASPLREFGSEDRERRRAASILVILECANAAPARRSNVMCVSSHTPKIQSWRFGRNANGEIPSQTLPDRPIQEPRSPAFACRRPKP